MNSAIIRESGRPLPATPAGNERLRALEGRVMDLKKDVEAAEAERDGLRRLGARLEPAVAQAKAVVDKATTVVGKARGSEEAAVKTS